MILPADEERAVNRQENATAFVPWPADEKLQVAWPTRRQDLFAAPARYVASTRANPDFGRPGWTRDCGKRFHRGVDIAPVRAIPAGRTTVVQFSDCARGVEYPSEEPILVPDDDVFCVADGAVRAACHDEGVSDFGRHVVVEHSWPRSRESFCTLYGHLDEVTVRYPQAVRAGQRLGRMGRSSRSADARNWLAIAPHLHFEAWDAHGRPYDPLEFLREFLRPSRQNTPLP
jgi:murein DD-endopeptidase MepM/ murein hydrolase activator NlpD